MGRRQCSKLYYVCLCYKSNRSILQDMNLPLFESKNNALSYPEKVTSVHHSLAKSLCLGNFLQ